MGLFGRIFGKRGAANGSNTPPGPHNTTALVFTDSIVRLHEHPDVADEDLPSAPGTTQTAKGTRPVDGTTMMVDEPLVKWCVRDAQASAHCVRLLLTKEGPSDAEWKRSLPRHMLAADTPAKKEPALGTIHVGQQLRPSRVDQLREVFDSVSGDPYVLLLDARMPLVGPDTMLLLQERLAKHDVCAFHLDGYWTAEPSLWRTAALREALDAAAKAGHEDIPSLFDEVDARPLDEGFFEALVAGSDDFRAIITAQELAQAEATVRARRE